MISLSYSRISLADIAQKLQLDSPEDADLFHPEEMKVWLLLPWERWGCLRAFPV